MTDTKQTNQMLIGLAGQQNAGKSTTFNMLTGANQHIANYPGVTVDKKSGSYKYKGVKVETVDLPGTYSLTSFSLEERVSRDFLITEKPDVIVNVVDASSLKRSLYLTFQILEMGFPIVVALNMMDVAKRNGTTIDVSALEHRLGVNVIPTVGRKGKGKKELKDAIMDTAERKSHDALKIDYEVLEDSLTSLEEKIRETELAQTYPARWLAVKLVEGDEEAQRVTKEGIGSDHEILKTAQDVRENFTENHYMDVADYMVGCRDRLASSIIATCVTEKGDGQDKITETIDKIVLNRFAAPIFLVATVFIIYQLSIVKGYDLTQYWWPILAKGRYARRSLYPVHGIVDGGFGQCPAQLYSHIFNFILPDCHT